MPGLLRVLKYSEQPQERLLEHQGGTPHTPLSCKLLSPGSVCPLWYQPDASASSKVESPPSSLQLPSGREEMGLGPSTHTARRWAALSWWEESTYTVEVLLSSPAASLTQPGTTMAKRAHPGHASNSWTSGTRPLTPEDTSQVHLKLGQKGPLSPCDTRQLMVLDKPVKSRLLRPTISSGHTQVGLEINLNNQF